MKEATPILKLPGKYNGTYKWPKLNEAYRHFTGNDVEGWHDALADAEACFTVFKNLVEAGVIKL